MFENVLVGVGGTDISTGLKGSSHTFLREKLSRGNSSLSEVLLPPALPMRND